MKRGGVIMKQIIETKLVEQTTVRFVAEDGKIFEGNTAECDCERYERLLNKAKIKKEYSKLDTIPIKCTLVNFYGSEFGYELITLKTKSDYIALTDYYKSLGFFDVEAMVPEPKSYPETKLIAYGSDWAQECTVKYNELIAELESIQRILKQYV